MHKILPFIFIALIAACASQTPQNLDITTAEPDRVRFQGKGAGAGMMLMSSMGPMGIAIGIAIDEGIAKDIDKAARAAGLEIKSVVSEAYRASDSRLNISALTIERYGFMTRSGDNDPVAVQLHISVAQADGSKLWVKYPEDFDKKDVRLDPLDVVKVDGSVSVEAIRHAAVAVLDRLATSLSQ